MDITIAIQYIRPELVILPVVLYFIGMTMKKSIYIKDHFIPFVLGAISIALCAIYVLSVSEKPDRYQEVLGLIFDIIIQGVCCAAASVYANQLSKQHQKMSNGEE